MMLLSKHELCVLSKRPKLAQFIFNGCAAGQLSHWAEALDESRYRPEGEEVPPDAEEEYRRRDMREEIQPLFFHPLDPALPEGVREAYERMLPQADEGTAAAADDDESKVPTTGHDVIMGDV